MNADVGLQEMTLGVEDTIEFGCGLGQNSSDVLERFKRQLSLEKEGMLPCREDWRDLLAKIQREARSKLTEEQKRLEALSNRLESSQQVVASLQITANCHKIQREALIKDLAKIRNEAGSSTIVHRSIEEELERWNRRIALYENELGFRIKRTRANDHLQVLFSGCNNLYSECDEKDTSSPCYCIFKQIGENHLELIKCNPPISDIDRLVEFFNQNGDIRSFLIILRRRFCQYFKLKYCIVTTK